MNGQKAEKDNGHEGSPFFLNWVIKKYLEVPLGTRAQARRYLSHFLYKRNLVEMNLRSCFEEEKKKVEW